MKTLFQLGFPTQRRFWVGQATGTVTSGGLDYALGLYQQIQAWLAKTSDPASSLGSNYARFQAMKSKADDLSANASSYGETLVGGGTLSDSENAEANQFYDAVTIAWGIILQAGPGVAAATPAAGPKLVTIPGAPAAPNATQQAITSAASSIAKAFSPQTPTTAKPVAPAPAPAPASNLTTPLLIGGGAVALILLVSLARG